MRFALMIAGAVLLCGVAVFGGPVPQGIPYVKDIHIDGSISQWKTVPPISDWNNKRNIVHGQLSWIGPAYLNGKGWLRWDNHNLHVAAGVTPARLASSF